MTDIEAPVTEKSNPAAGEPVRRQEGVSDGPRFRWKDLTVYLGFVLVFAFFAVTIGGQGFLSAQNATSIVSQVTPIALMAFGAVFVPLPANRPFDRVHRRDRRALYASGSGTMGSFLASPSEFDRIGAGLLNGLLIVRLRVPSFLVTLGTMQLFTRIAQISTQLQDVPIVTIPTRICRVRHDGPLSNAVVWLLLRFLVAQIAFKNLAFGSRVMTTRSNRGSARRSASTPIASASASSSSSSCTAALAGMIYAGEVHGAVLHARVERHPHRSCRRRDRRHQPVRRVRQHAGRADRLAS